MASMGAIISCFIMSQVGRRKLYLYGLGGLTSILCTIGIISATAGNSVAGNYAQAGLILGWLLMYYLTVGPICYAIITETSLIRLRSKSVCLSRITYYIAQIICNGINPYILNPTAGNYKGKTGFFWGGCLFAFSVWTFFRLPETKRRTFEEIDILFANEILARKFKSYHVNTYAEGEGVLEKSC